MDSNIISEKTNSHRDTFLAFGETVHDNDITRALIDFIANQTVGNNHRYVIDALYNLWD